MVRDFCYPGMCRLRGSVDERLSGLMLSLESSVGECEKACGDIGGEYIT